MDAETAHRPSDATLMAGLANGEIGNLGPLYRRYGVAVQHFVSSVLVTASSADTEDICQDVFLTLYKTAPKYRESGTLRGWLFGIAVRKAR